MSTAVALQPIHESPAESRKLAMRGLIGFRFPAKSAEHIIEPRKRICRTYFFTAFCSAWAESSTSATSSSFSLMRVSMHM